MTYEYEGENSYGYKEDPHTQDEVSAIRTRYRLPDELEIERLVVDAQGESQELFCVKAIPHDYDPLPRGYCYIGGVARSLAFALTQSGDIPVRDVDLVAIRDFGPELLLLPELSERYMTDDYTRGHGADVRYLDQYFQTRDFTLNEVLLDGHDLYLTPAALEDIRAHVIRPTEYLFREDDDFEGVPYVPGNSVMKAVRLMTELINITGDGRIEGIEDWQYQADNLPVFAIALSLDKALQKGDAVATRFYEKLLELGSIHPLVAPSSDAPNNCTELALNINAQIIENGRDPYIFSNDELNKLGEESRRYDDLLGRLESRMGNSRSKRAAQKRAQYV